MNAELAGREIVEGLRLQPIEAPDQHQVAVLTYRTDQPYAVRLTFLSADLAALFTCTFERGLLIDGLLIDQPDDDGTTLIGAGEVQVGPGPIEDRVLLRLRLHDGEWFELYADRSRLQAVVDSTVELVPISRERELVDVDAAIAAILREVSS